MARVYADVNQQMPRSYWDYDSVNITWGVLENYEVVRKIGRLDSAHFDTFTCREILTTLRRTWEVLGSLPGHQCYQLPGVRYQGAEAGQEEEDKERNQDLAEPLRRTEYYRSAGCR